MEDYLLAPVRQFSAWHRGAEGHSDVGLLRQSAPGDNLSDGSTVGGYRLNMNF